VLLGQELLGHSPSLLRVVLVGDVVAINDPLPCFAVLCATLCHALVLLVDSVQWGVRISIESGDPYVARSPAQSALLLGVIGRSEDDG
jgi:hypothetical protein